MLICDALGKTRKTKSFRKASVSQKLNEAKPERASKLNEQKLNERQNLERPIGLARATAELPKCPGFDEELLTLCFNLPKPDTGQFIKSSSDTDRPCFSPDFSNHQLTSRFCKAFGCFL